MNDDDQVALIDEARERRHVSELSEAQRLREEAEMVRNLAVDVVANLVEAWGDVVDRRDSRWDDELGQNRTVYPVTQKTDREHGGNPPVFDTELELAAIRGAARLLDDTSPHAQTIRDNLLNFVVAKGYTHKAQPRREGQEELAAEVQYVLDEFHELNDWTGQHGSREEEVITRSIRDGETFVALFDPGRDGRAVARFIEPDQVTEPQSPEIVERRYEEIFGHCPASDWKYGVQVTSGDVEDVLGYHLQFTHNTDDWDWLPKSRCIHLKLNTDRNVKRGLSSYYSVQSYLTDIGKLERNVVRGAAILSAILGIRQHASGVKRSDAETLVQKAMYRSYTRSQPGGDTLRKVQRLNPGSWLDVSDGLEYKPPPLATQGVGSAFVEIDQATLRTVGLRYQMPEYMISGDASNANFASAMVAEAPVVKRFEREQNNYAGDFRTIDWAVVRIACERNRFGGATFDDVRRNVTISVKGPRVAAREKAAETNRNKILFDNGQLSARGWSEEEGIDYEQEQSRGAKVNSNMLPARDQGGRPPVDNPQRPVETQS